MWQDSAPLDGLIYALYPLGQLIVNFILSNKPLKIPCDK